MTAVKDILAQIPLDQLSSELGVSQSEAKTAATQAITALLGGLHNNAQDESGEAALAKALSKHASTGEALAAGNLSLGGIDLSDGAKIVQHALGHDTDTVAAHLSTKTGSNSSLLSQLLPILAPIVMGYLANKSTTTTHEESGGSILDSVLGGVLGSSTTTSSSSSSGALGGLLGGILSGVLAGGTTTATTTAIKKTTTAKKTTTKKTTATKKTTTANQTTAEESSGGLLGSILDSIF
ncbi:MAG: DUF937 domain-containing protein [Propionibacteriaceae bacterium]|jgi:hypothetical protein|nr:DUF937 domain-containing protein [Propionibacteriaceae bacterium]